ncbi:MAG TPA: prepilin-type N-terminal cleavage/methylation domain-containing protein [Candidatus Acidoferrales bacterium]
MKREDGFSLVELMVTLGILVVIVGTTLAALTQASQATQSVTMMADTQENLRAGLNYMVRDLVQAGESIPQGGIPLPNNAGVVNVNKPSPPSLAYTFPTNSTVLQAITPGFSQGLPTATPSPANPSVTLFGPNNTDMITMVYADNSLIDNTIPGNPRTLNESPIFLAASGTNPGCPNGSIAANGSQIRFDPNCININTGNTGLKVGDLIMFQNAGGVTLQCITGVAGEVVSFAGGDPFKLNQTGLANSTLPQTAVPPNSGAYPPTTATRIWMVTYYIDSKANPQRPMLMRQVNFNPAVAVAEVIENLNVTYDIVDAIATAPAANAPQIIAPDTPAQIRKVNLLLAARSESISLQSHQYFRNNLQTEVSIQSLSFFSLYQ